jgi:hypothetical protein
VQSGAEPAVAADGTWVLPADYTFTLDDGGVHTFTGQTTLRTIGDQTLTATDTADASISGFVVVTIAAQDVYRHRDST